MQAGTEVDIRGWLLLRQEHEQAADKPIQVPAVSARRSLRADAPAARVWPKPVPGHFDRWSVSFLQV